MKWLRSTALNHTEADQFERIVREHGRLVFSITYSILRNTHDAEDVTQEVFLRLMRYRNRMPFVRNHRAFLSRVAQRMALDRRIQLRKYVSMENVAEPELPPLDGAQLQESFIIAALLRTLPEELRQVIELSQVEELTSAEIARILRIPAGTVRSRLVRAREMLKDKFLAKMGAQYVRSRR